MVTILVGKTGVSKFVRGVIGEKRNAKYGFTAAVALSSVILCSNKFENVLEDRQRERKPLLTFRKEPANTISFRVTQPRLILVWTIILTSINASQYDFKKLLTRLSNEQIMKTH